MAMVAAAPKDIDTAHGHNTEHPKELGNILDESGTMTGDAPDEDTNDDGVPPTPEELRLRRYAKMLKRAGFTPDQHVENLARVQKKEGADAVKLGAVSGQQYKEIFRSRAFDQYFFQIPPKKSSLEMLSKVARKILSKDPTADEEHRKLEEEEAKLGGASYAGKSKQKNLKERTGRHPIGFKKDLFGPPGLAPPQKKILNSEGREKYFSYDGGWVDGKMHGYGTYRFADGMTYEGGMRDNWPSGEGTAHYSNGGAYVGSWKDGKYEGYGKLTCPEGTVYEGSWHEGQRSGPGTLKFKSGSEYKGDFLLGVYHGRGRFKSANLNVSYHGCWSSGFICGQGTLTMPDGTTTVRAWPQQGRFGGGLSLRGAMEMVQIEIEQARRNKVDEQQALYGVTELVELQFRVQNIRREVHERRSVEKAEDRAEAAAKRRAAKLAMMEAKLKALFDAEKGEEPDDIEKEFMT